MQVGVNTHVVCSEAKCGWNDEKGGCFFPGTVYLNRTCTHKFVEYQEVDTKVENKSPRSIGAMNNQESKYDFEKELCLAF